LQAAFAEGALSLDKVLAVARVATAETDVKFTTIARAASVAQLQRICAAYRDATGKDTPEAHEARRCRRGVSSRPTDDGLVRIVALLEPDEASIVLSALDARAEEAWRDERPSPDAPLPDISTRPRPRRRADPHRRTIRRHLHDRRRRRHLTPHRSPVALSLHGATQPRPFPTHRQPSATPSAPLP
jgi:hypothetical protein